MIIIHNPWQHSQLRIPLTKQMKIQLLTKKTLGLTVTPPPSSPLCIADKTPGSIQKSHSWFQYWLVRGIGGLGAWNPLLVKNFLQFIKQILLTSNWAWYCVQTASDQNCKLLADISSKRITSFQSSLTKRALKMSNAN